MLNPNAESPLKYQSSTGKLNPFHPASGDSLPKISSQSPSSHLNNYNGMQLNDRNTPLKRSFSMSAIIHGDTVSSNGHYIDSLQRFKRNHDATNKEERERQRQLQMKKLMQRRSLKIRRDEEVKEKQEDRVRQVIEKNSRILDGYQQGLIRNNTYHNSLAINPITKKYEANMRGQTQKQLDNEEHVRKLLRGHRMESMGTSGFNPINGSSIDNISKLVAKNKDIEGVYSEKLEKLSEKYKIRAQSIEDFDRFSASKLFKYH